METIHHLKENMKKLRLPGMSDSLELRAKEARENDLGYLEFVSFLIQDEILNRESNNLEKRVRKAGFSSLCTFEGFDFNFNREAIPPKTIRDLAVGQFVADHRNLILCGPPGIGKSHIAQAIGYELCRKGQDVFFRKTHKLLEQLSDSSYAKRVQRIWKSALSAKLLILDDFAFRKYDQKEAEILYALADERLGKGSTIITSNRPTEDWFAVFPDPVIGGAILDRFASGAIRIITTKGRSYRKERAFSPDF